MGSIKLLLDKYGYIILFISLFFELLALPLPGEILMSYCGFVVFQGKLNLNLCIIVSTLGVISGVTLSYLIGKKVGVKFFNKYGQYIHLGPEKLEKVDKWFDKYGNKFLIVTYFIPGIRHITGYTAGITNLSYKKFAINAYLGAFIWITIFIVLGKSLGANWNSVGKYIGRYLILGFLILIIAIGIIYLLKKIVRCFLNI